MEPICPTFDRGLGSTVTAFRLDRSPASTPQATGFEMKKLITSSCALIVALISASAVEITGKVSSVSGELAAIAIEGEMFPAIGDKVEIFFKIAGQDVSVANGSVLKVDGDSVQVRIEDATGEVVQAQLVRITSEKPQKRTTSPATTPATPAPAPSPGSQELAEAESLYAKQDYDGAIAALNKAIALRPNDPTIFFMRANCHIYKQAWDDVIADAEQLLALGYAYPGQSYLVRAQGRLGKGDIKGSLEDLAKVIEINPEWPGGYIGRAEVSLRLREWKNVLADCNKAIALAPNSAQAYVIRGCYYSHIGATEAAEADWKKAIALDPASESIIDANRKTYAPTPAATKKSSRKR